MIAIVPVERKEEVNLIFDCRASILEVSFGFEFVIHCLIFRFLIFNFDILTVFFHIIMVKKRQTSKIRNGAKKSALSKQVNTRQQ